MAKKNWNMQISNKLKQIKPIITLWPSIAHRKTDVLLTRLPIDHPRITHRHSLVKLNLHIHIVFSHNLPFTTFWLIAVVYAIYTDIISEHPHYIWQTCGWKSPLCSFSFFKRCRFLSCHIDFFKLFFYFNLISVSIVYVALILSGWETLSRV